MSRRPHVVIFNPDQWRGDVLGHVGNPVGSSSKKAANQNVLKAERTKKIPLKKINSHNLQNVAI
jgi:hypothetical protein